MRQHRESSQSRKRKICRENPRVEVEEAEKEEEERQWCCEWCDENFEHLLEQIWQLQRREVEREEMWKNKFQQLDFFQKIFFQRVNDFENVFVSQVQMSENLAGVYDGLENVNGRVNGLKGNSRGLCRVLSNDNDRNAK